MAGMGSTRSGLGLDIPGWLGLALSPLLAPAWLPLDLLSRRPDIVAAR